MFGEIQDSEIFRIDSSYLEEQVKGVSMGEIEVTTNTKKVLFTFGLASCIGIYAYSKDFGILGHIDSGDMFDQHFEYNYKFLNGKCERIRMRFKQTGNIMYAIRQKKDEIKAPIKIGMIIGSDADIMCKDQMEKIDVALNSIVKMTQEIGLSIEKQEPIRSSYVIVDTENLLLKAENNTFVYKSRTI